MKQNFFMLLLGAGLIVNVSSACAESAQMDPALGQAEERALQSIEWFKANYPTDPTFQVPPAQFAARPLRQYEVEEEPAKAE